MFESSNKRDLFLWNVSNQFVFIMEKWCVHCVLRAECSHQSSPVWATNILITEAGENMFFAVETETLGTTVRNLVVVVNRCPEFVYPAYKYWLDGFQNEKS
jgi:hypothetical protein